MFANDATRTKASRESRVGEGEPWFIPNYRRIQSRVVRKKRKKKGESYGKAGGLTANQFRFRSRRQWQGQEGGGMHARQFASVEPRARVGDSEWEDHARHNVR